jgi:hypothetical protein
VIKPFLRLLEKNARCPVTRTQRVRQMSFVPCWISKELSGAKVTVAEFVFHYMFLQRSCLCLVVSAGLVVGCVILLGLVDIILMV